MSLKPTVLCVALVMMASPAWAQSARTFRVSCDDGLSFQLSLRPDAGGGPGRTATLTLGEDPPQLLLIDSQAETTTYENARYRFQALADQKVFQLIELRNGRTTAIHTCR